MALLERWRPLRQMDRLRSEFDDLLDRFGFDREGYPRLPRELWGEAGTTTRPAIESYVQDGKLMVLIDLPGIEAKDVDIKVLDGVLTVKGQREDKRERSKVDYLRREIRYGAFERAISLPEGIRAEDLKATYRDGVLEVTAPMPKEAVPAQVKVQIEVPNADAQKKPAPGRAAA